MLRAIKDLEFDYAMKKVAQRDFEEMSARLRARAIGLMRQLETDGGYRAQIEREIAQRLQPKESAPSGAPAGTEQPAMAAASVCTCGTANDNDARFCKNCGTSLTAA